MAEHPFDWRGRGVDDTAGCGECGDSGWIEINGADVRPCSRCQPGLYGRWRADHLASDHDRDACGDPECRKLASPAATPLRPPDPADPLRPEAREALSTMRAGLAPEEEAADDPEEDWYDDGEFDPLTGLAR